MEVNCNFVGIIAANLVNRLKIISLATSVPASSKSPSAYGPYERNHAPSNPINSRKRLGRYIKLASNILRLLPTQTFASFPQDTLL